MQERHDYSALTPNLILNAIEAQGYLTNLSLFPLNSYENRVYQIGLDAGGFLIAKFYRPQRWSDAAILEEHQFSLELVDRDVPVVAPLANEQGTTLFNFEGYRFALFPRNTGRWPEMDQLDTHFRIGRFLGRIHAVGEIAQFVHRPHLSAQAMGRDALDVLIEQNVVPQELRDAYVAVANSVIETIDRNWSKSLTMDHLRIHGDCHPGNILWTDTGPHFVDLDDCISGPAVQDIWMLLSGDRTTQLQQLGEIVDGYEEFHEFPRDQLVLIEPLRALRMIHYAAWLARRWSDPAFPHHFPWFATTIYWQDQILALKEQLSALQEEPLSLQI